MSNKTDKAGYPYGFLCPIIIVIIGFGDNQRIQPRWGTWRGSEHMVNGNFNKAHRDAQEEAEHFIKK